MILSNQYSPLPQNQPQFYLYHHRFTLPVLELYLNWATRWMCFFGTLFLNMVFLRSIHLHMGIFSVFLIVEWYPSGWIHHRLFNLFSHGASNLASCHFPCSLPFKGMYLCQNSLLSIISSNSKFCDSLGHIQSEECPWRRESWWEHLEVSEREEHPVRFLTSAEGNLHFCPLLECGTEADKGEGADKVAKSEFRKVWHQVGIT